MLQVHNNHCMDMDILHSEVELLLCNVTLVFKVAKILWWVATNFLRLAKTFWRVGQSILEAWPKKIWRVDPKKFGGLPNNEEEENQKFADICVKIVEIP